MIKLTSINKIYRTNEIETVALENVNLEVNMGHRTKRFFQWSGKMGERF